MTVFDIRSWGELNSYSNIIVLSVYLYTIYMYVISMTLESVLIGLLSLYVLISRLRVLPKCRSVWISMYSVGTVSLISCETGSTGITLCDPSRKRWMSTCRWRGRDRWDILVVLVVCWPYSVPNVKRGTSIGTRAYPGDEGGLPASPKHCILWTIGARAYPVTMGSLLVLCVLLFVYFDMLL